MKMLSSMIMLATEAHDGQFDKGGRPYILHSLTVMHKLRTEDEELMCMAAGHDVIEDGKIKGVRVTYAMLAERSMSDRVIEGIRCLTRVPGGMVYQVRFKAKNVNDEWVFLNVAHSIGRCKLVPVAVAARVF